MSLFDIATAAQVTLPSPNLFAVSPMIALIVTAVVELALMVGSRKDRGMGYPIVAFMGIAVALAFAIGQINYSPVTTFSGNWRMDDFSVFFDLAILISGLLAVLIGQDWLRFSGYPQVEFYTVMLCSMTGMLVSASSYNLITLFIGIELTSVPVYVLTGYAKHERVSNEGAMKYFLLGAFSSAILLYGLVWTYGVTGGTGYDAIRRFIGNGTGDFHGALLFASLLIIAGLSFKIAAVPFHMWTPDAYQGAPTVVTAFMSVSVKAGAFAGLIRILTQAMPGISADWSVIVIAIAIITMLLGNFVAIAQNDVKRMLAYSTIGHTGFMLVGLGTWSPSNTLGASSVLFYVFAYVFMNLGAFAVLAWVENHGGSSHIDDLDGLFSQAPAAAMAMGVFMLGLMGFPLTVGLPAKVFVFQSAAAEGRVWLALLGLLISAVGAFYYMRVVVRMFMYQPKAALASPKQPMMAIGIAASAVGTVLLGVLFSPIFDLAQRAVGG